MRYPTAADIADLIGKTSEWFEAWLRVGLGEYLFERKGREAFPEVRNFVDQGEGNIAADLCGIWEVLPIREQEAFKRGVTRLMQSLDYARPAHEAIAISVLELGAGIGADALLSVLAAKSFSMSPEHGARLYDLAFELPAQLADLNPDATVRCIRHLITHDSLFTSQLAGRALIALTQARPDQFPEHFRILGPMLDAKYGYALEDENAEERRARARVRLLRGLSRRTPDKRVLAEVFDQGEGRFIWWLDTLAAEMPEILEGGSQAAPPESTSPHAAAVREFGLGSSAAIAQSFSAHVLAEVRATISDVWHSTGRKAVSLAGIPNDFSGDLQFGQTAEVELAVAIGDLGSTLPVRPSEIRPIYDWQNEEERA